MQLCSRLSFGVNPIEDGWQLTNIRQHKNVANSVSFTNIKLKFGVVVAKSHSPHLL